MDFRSRYKYNTETDLLGKGGFARVYKAYDTLLDREVAIKVFNVSESSVGSVLNEIKKAIKLHHPNLLSYYDVAILENVNAFGETEKMEIGVMEYANFGDLKNFMATNEDRNGFIKILKEVLYGLSYLHSKGIIHRDLKPQNILLVKENNVITAKISDFGISKVIEKDAVSNSAMMGTIEYMAPEQFEPRRYGVEGHISTNLDIWAFGIMLYELMANSKPFGQRGGDTTAEAIMQRILTTELPPELESIPEPFKSVIKKCLVADAKVRVSDCEELIAILDNKPSAATPKAHRANLIVGEETQVFDRNSMIRKAPEPAKETHIADVVQTAPQKQKPKPEPKPEEDVPEEDDAKKSKAPLIIVLLLLVALGGITAYYLLTETKRAVTFDSAMDSYKKNDQTGLSQMRGLAYAGNIPARRFLGDYFWERKNNDSAFAYYGLLTTTPEKGIMAKMGEIYYKGLGHIQSDTNKARTLFESAANKENDTLAYVRLGEIYYYIGAKSVPPNLDESFKWSKKAAEAGSLNGMVSLGTIYYQRLNFAEALKWYSKAADMNFGAGNYWVGYIYQNGDGVPVDKEKARTFFKAARDLGYSPADSALLKLAQ